MGHGTFSPVSILVGLLLLIANGYFVSAEIALLAARRARIEERAAHGEPRAITALQALNELTVTFTASQLGITLASLGLGAVAEPAVAAGIEQLLGVAGLGGASRTAIAFGIALSIVVFLHMVVGEMAPKNLALVKAEEVSIRIARSFSWYVTLFRPLILALNAAANAMVRMAGVEPRDQEELAHTPDDLISALRESGRRGTVEPHDARVMTSVLRLAQIDAESAMTPRVDLVAVPQGSSIDAVLDVAATTGFTRLPVYEGELDRIVGIVHVKDLLMCEDGAIQELSVNDVVRPLPAVPEMRDLEGLLREMRAGNVHAARVVDEYGGTAGLVTLEDVLEELLGDVEDEFDTEWSGPEHPDERTWIVSGLIRRDELFRLTGCRLEGYDAATVSGVVTECVGRLLEEGDCVETEDGWRLSVLSVTGSRAADVEVTAPSRAGGEGQQKSVGKGT